MKRITLYFLILFPIGIPGILSSFFPNPSFHFNLTSFFAPEICDNGIDDDGDGFVDFI
jgi:hypothetical protein